MGEAILARASGGGGGKFASGSFTFGTSAASDASETVSIDIGFEPTGIVIYSTTGNNNGSTSRAYVTVYTYNANANIRGVKCVYGYAEVNSSYAQDSRFYSTTAPTYSNGVLTTTTHKTTYGSYPVYFRGGTAYMWYAWA